MVDIGKGLLFSSVLCLLSTIVYSHGNNNLSNYRRPILNQLNALRQNISGYNGTIDYKYYNNKGEVSRVYSLDEEEIYNTDDCRPNQKFAIIVHGWTESCDTPWVRDLVKNLIKYRGGCIICMDYKKYSSLEYFRLVRSFDSIANVLTTKLLTMEFQGFNPDDGYLFGFSFGAQLVAEAGRRFGPLKLKEIDICDMAGPGFDFKQRQPDHKLSAQNVQCIHTSTDKGTRHSNCHQNWKMGNCGIFQVGSKSPPYGSHGLCPLFYNSAFENNFYAIQKPNECSSNRAAISWPTNFKMGYTENRKNGLIGEFFAITTKNPPYTLNLNDNIHRFNVINQTEDEENFSNLDDQTTSINI